MIEVETKALINSIEKYNEIKKHISEYYEMLTYNITESEQLNHYFKIDKNNLINLLDQIYNIGQSSTLTELKKDLLNLADGEDFSLRTRWDSESGIFFIVKTGKDSINGDSRREYELLIDGEDINDLDLLLVKCGARLDSKWNRKRLNYLLANNISISLDITSGYGHVIEIEKMILRDEEIKVVKKQQLNLLNCLGLKELDKTLLNKMYKYYVDHWNDYYRKDFYLLEDEDFHAYLED